MATCKDCISFSRCKEMYEAFGVSIDLENSVVCKHFKNKADFEEVVRCKDCVHSRQPRHPKYAQPECVILNAIVKDDFYCAKGQTRTPKERGADKQKITCLNCKHLMFSDMYGECNKQLRIVNPNDTCEYAEPKEGGGEK